MVFNEDKRLQRVIKTTKGKEQCFSTNFWLSQGLLKILKLNFFIEMAVVLSIRTAKVRFIRTFDADGPEKMFVLSKVRVTVVRLNRFLPG